jgi:hypothetical protein
MLEELLGRIEQLEKSTRRSSKDRICYNCNKPGHIQKYCPHNPRKHNPLGNQGQIAHDSQDNQSSRVPMPENERPSSQY